MKKRIKDFFDRYINVDTAYVSGGGVFLTEGDALAYGKGDVVKVTRSGFARANNPLAEPLTKERIENMSHDEMKAAVRERGLKVDNMKKETLLAALLAVAE